MEILEEMHPKTNEGCIITPISSFKSNYKCNLIETKYPISVVEVNHPEGRYIWVNTDHSFKYDCGGRLCIDLVTIGGTLYGARHEKYYNTTLPGTQNKKGWNFALQLYKCFKKYYSGRFVVYAPVTWNDGTSDLRFEVDSTRLQKVLVRQFGRRIVESMWTGTTVRNFERILKARKEKREKRRKKDENARKRKYFIDLLNFLDNKKLLFSFPLFS